MEPSWVWGFNWSTVGEIFRFFLACAWIAVAAVITVHLIRYVTSVYQKVRCDGESKKTGRTH